jgi:hypothetical protein
MLDFLARGYNNVREVVGERDKLLDIQTTIKLAADDGVVTFEEIRGDLRKFAKPKTQKRLVSLCCLDKHMIKS